VLLIRIVSAAGFVVLFVANAMRAALPATVSEQGRDPSERRKAAIAKLRIIWLGRFTGLFLCGAGVLHEACLLEGVSLLASLPAGFLAVFLLGEILPARLGSVKPEFTARLLRFPFGLMRMVFTVPAFLILGSSRDDEALADEWVFTPPDLMWLEQRLEKGDQEEYEKEQELMDSILEFSDKIVREVMVPRIDMVCVELSDDLESVVRQVTAAGHSRIPVYREKIDDIAGLLYAKDLIGVPSGRSDGFHMTEIIREAYFVPEYKRIDTLFREFQSHRIHMAIVVDEYGGTAGLVTIEDIIEEVFGEIVDEYDSEAPLVQSLGRKSYRIDARLSVDDLNAMLDTEFDDADYESVGGMVYQALGRIPRPGEYTVLGGYRFTVDKVRAQRILLVRVTPATPEEDPGK
jgi:CBS domain containing-hemolysin-like protein